MREWCRAIEQARPATTRRAARRNDHVSQLVGYENGADAPQRATAAALERASTARAVVLVEGISDQIAVETLALRLGRNLEAEDVVVVPIGGAHAIGRFVGRFAEGLTVEIIGLCDHSERHYFAKAFDYHGLSGRHMFFVCDADLEDELIRAIDAPGIEAILDDERELNSFRTMQKQPAWNGRPFDEQIHRWIRSHSRRSSRYAKLVLEQASLDRVPQPLLELIDHI